jgi:hypothetical protein
LAAAFLGGTRSDELRAPLGRKRPHLPNLAARPYVPHQMSFVRLLDEHDLLVCPCTLMPPFDAGLRYPSTLTRPSGAKLDLEDYIEWMLPCSILSLVSTPRAPALLQRPSLLVPPEHLNDGS